MKVKLYKIFFLIIAGVFSAFLTVAQTVTVTFNAAVYGQSLEGLSFAQLLSTHESELKARLTIKVREAKAGNVVTVVVPDFYLRRGGNIIDRSAYSRSRFSFGNNYLGRTLSLSGKFPEGEYEYCFEIDLSGSKVSLNEPFIEQCLMQDIQPLTPLLLINPADGDKECNKRPVLTWQPPMPLPAGARFRVVMAELSGKQDIVEAINYNIPVINQDNIPVNQLNFPFNAPDLKKGKTYAWQVIMYTGTVILKRSEIWKYTVECTEETPQVSTDSYRELKESSDGNFYAASKVVRFSFSNAYSAGVLNYSIVNLLNPSMPVAGLPKLTMQTGLNKYDLDLSENRAFKNGQEYQLTVKLISGRELKLRFTYRNE